MTLRESAVEIRANLEYPACPLCGNDPRNFPFRLSAPGGIRRGEHDPYRVRDASSADSTIFIRA
jgi:hypothetical protein